MGAFSHLYQGIYFIPQDVMGIVETGQQVQRLTPKDSLVLASYGGSTSLLYYCDRKGWAFDVRSGNAPQLIQELEKRKTEGAKYFVTSRSDQVKAVPELDAYLRKDHEILLEQGENLIIALN